MLIFLVTVLPLALEQDLELLNYQPATKAHLEN